MKPYLGGLLVFGQVSAGSLASALLMSALRSPALIPDPFPIFLFPFGYFFAQIRLTCF